LAGPEAEQSARRRDNQTAGQIVEVLDLTPQHFVDILAEHATISAAYMLRNMSHSKDFQLNR
jgi:hypothetical protein